MTKKISSVFFIITAFVFLSGFGGDPSSDITSGELQEHITYLSSDQLAGRLPGTPGDKLAQEYIMNKFKSYGLLPAGDNGNYIQSFEMITSVALGKNNSFTELSPSDRSFTLGVDYTPLGFSTDGSTQSNLVFAGYGISAPGSNYDDYAGIDVTGKVAVIMRYTPFWNDPHNSSLRNYASFIVKTITAKEKGAAGIIFVTGPQDNETDELVGLSFNNGYPDAGIPVINLTRDAFDDLFSSTGKTIAGIQDEINSSGSPASFETNIKVSIEADVDPQTITTGNVVGMLEGNDPTVSDEVIVIGAHYDHLGYGEYGSLYAGTDRVIHHGADDNASGTAGVIELAQKLAAEKETLKRDVIFILFSGEEAGLLGSNFYTKSDEFENLNIVAMLNMDMIGRLQDNKLVIYGIGSSPMWETTIKNLNNSYNFDITYTQAGFGRSDHSSFYSNNIPAVHFFSGTHTDYHRPSDTYDKINSTDAEKIVKLVYDVTKEIDNEKTRPEFTKAEEENDDNRTMGNIRIYVGTIPDYAYDGKGMKLSGVKEGGPAEKGGMQAGDIIIKFGEKTVENIYDFMYAMQSYKPDDVVDFVVLRDGKEVNLKLTMEKR